MVSKNNHQFYQQKHAERKQRWGVRKLSVGVASVLLGTTFMLHSNHAVSADTVPTTTPTDATVQTDSNVADHQGSEVTLRTTADKEETVATTTNAEEKVVATNTQDTTQDKDKQTNANETTQNTTNVDKKDTEVTPTNDATTATPKTTAKVNAPATPTAMKAAATAETPDPTVPDNSANTAIVNDKNSLTKNWLETPNERAQVYITVKGTDQKIYVSSYADFKKRLYSVIYTNRMDPNSLELHIEYQVLKDRVQNFIVNWGEWLRLDTSRIGKDGLTFITDTGEKVAYTLTPGWGKYKTYDEWLKEGQDMSAMNALKIGNNLKAGTNFTLTVPLKYIGGTDGKKQFNNIQVVDYGQPNANMGFDFIELHPEQIDTPEAPTTDKESVTTGIYNNPLATATDWYKTEHGEYVAYYTAKGKDGKTYVTGYVAANGKSESIINVDQIDLNNLEYHMIYRNGDEEVAAGISASFADGKTLVVDASRIGADGIRLKSQQGWSYNNVDYRESTSGRLYYSWEDFLKNHNGSVDNLVGINMNASAFKPGDTIEVVVPVKYIGKLSDRVQSLEFKSEARKDVSVKLYFTTVRMDLSQIKQVILLPAEFVSEKPGQSNWKYVKEIASDMPNGWDVVKISNFPVYKGIFNTDLSQISERPDVIYGTAAYFVDLQEIQKIFARHGYTVKFVNNNGQAQQMPFYSYSTLPLASFIDGKPIDTSSIWAIQVQAVPALILNKDQYYRADPNAGAWDTTSMIDAIYGADDPGARKSREELDQLPKTDVNISYEYQAPGATTTVKADKVDLTKAGVYTVTYSHTYADGVVVSDSRKVYVDDVKQETKDITRTIIVHTPNGTDQTVIQKATLTREVILDATTGEVKSTGEWSTAKWETYSAPDFKGYTPDVAQVEEATVTKDTQDTTVEINYAANDQQTHVIYVDDDNNGDPIKTEMLNGKTGETVATNIANPDESKYELVGTPEAEYTFAAENNEDVIVHLKHKHGQQVEEKTITRTINVTHPDGSHESIKQTVTLNRTNEVDLATGEVVKDGEWTTGSWEEFAAPEHAGYTPNIAKVEQTDVTADTQDTTVEINYTANKPTTPEQNNDQGQKPQTPDSNKNGKHDQSTGENTQPSGSTTKTKAPVTANKVTKKLPQTGEKENQLGLLGVVLAALGVFGFGWKKREHE